MKIRTFALATAAVSLAASPAIAEAAYERANAPVEDESELAGGASIIIAVRMKNDLLADGHTFGFF